MEWAFCVPLVPLAVLSVQDFRTRTVSVPWVVLFGVLALAASFWGCTPLTVVAQVGINLLLLLYLCGGVWLWFRIRYGKEVRPWKTHIGLGDIWLLLCLTPCFPPDTFLVFLVVSLTAGLLFYGIVRAVIRRPLSIPLVGVIGVTFTLYVFISPLFS